jgi:Na+/proline symporter
MLPPMIYKVIDPSLQGLDTENAYLKICQLVLPPGLMGLMLTGMYFSTSATANTTLNVVSAVFTNDLYRNKYPNSTEKQLMRVARISSWILGILMIAIALVVPIMGGMVGVVLSVAAVTAGPLLAPPVWALFSKRLSGLITLRITIFTLLINLFFKLVLPIINGIKLDRSQEMAIGMGIPVLLLLINEIIQKSKNQISKDYITYIADREVRKIKLENTPSSFVEKLQIKKQNAFGLRIIAFSLLVTALTLFILGFLTPVGGKITLITGLGILVVAIIPWLSAMKAKKEINILNYGNHSSSSGTNEV